MEITRKSAAEVAKMRSAGRIVAEVLALVEESLAPGISTAEIDRLAERHIRASGGVPSFLGYLGGRRYDASHPHAYKASTCISIDHEIVHGIPGNREIKRGQVVSVDVGAIYDGWNGDGARTFICGGRDAGTAAAIALIDTTRLALMAGIAAAQQGPWRGIILVGDEPYYAKVGFSRLPPGRVKFPGPVDQNRILGLSLKAGEILNLSGEVRRAQIDDAVCANGAGVG